MEFPKTLGDANRWLERIGAKAKGYYFYKVNKDYCLFNTDELYGKSEYLFDLILVSIKEFYFKRDFELPEDYKERFRDEKMKSIYFEEY